MALASTSCSVNGVESVRPEVMRAALKSASEPIQIPAMVTLFRFFRASVPTARNYFSFFLSRQAVSLTAL